MDKSTSTNTKHAGVSVKVLMVGETNSMLSDHLMTKDNSVQLGVWGGVVSPPAGAGQHHDWS